MQQAAKTSAPAATKDVFDQSELTDHHIVIEKPINYYRGYCYTVEVEGCCPANPNDWSDSRWYVFEDGKLLGPRNTAYPLIARDGLGTFTYAYNKLFFSTSDNTDPNTNGRVYSYARRDDLFFKERFTYCLNQVKWLLRVMSLDPKELSGKRVLEIGPGRDLGVALIMCGLGAHTTGVEKYRTGWLENWHGPFIEMICQEAPKHFPTFNPQPLLDCVDKQSFSAAFIQQLAMAVEDFDPSSVRPFHITYSLATLEHVSNPAMVTKIIYQATEAGGKGLHAIDFRDHRDFSKPLEMYLLDDAEFEQLAHQQTEAYYFGNRVPASHFTRFFKEAGFPKVTCTFNGPPINEEYLQDFLIRLKASKSCFQDISEDDLRTISAYYILEK